MCYLAGSTPFPLTSPPLGDVLSAHATLHLLTDGPSTIFEDAECARLYAEACSRLSKFEEAETALRWTASRTDKSSTFSSGKVHPSADAKSPTGSSVDLSKGMLEPHRVVPGLTREQVRAQAHDEAELAALACKSGKSQDAEIGYAAAGVDPWNWRAWIGRCGLASDPSAEYAFPGALAHHSPAVFFAAVFLERLSAAGIEITAEGCLSWVAGRSANAEQEGRVGSMSKANAAVAKESNVVEAAAAAPTRAGTHTSAPQVRPGSRHPSQTAGSAVFAGVKRVRAAGTVAAPSSANATRSQSTTRSGAAATTRPGVRQGLSIGRQNEPPTRPASSMSGSSILTSSANAADEKPTSSQIVIGGSQSQRVTRSALAPTSGAAQTRSRTVISQGGRSAATRNTPSSASQTTPAPQGAARTNAVAGRTAVATGTQAPRRAMRAGAPSSATSSENEAGPGHRNAGLPAGRSNSSGQNKERNNALGEEPAAMDRALREVLRASCEEAARLACIWSAVDGAVLDVVRTMAEAYGALSRNVGRKACWVLRPSEEMFGETSSGSKTRSLGVGEGWKDRGDHRRGSLPASVRDAPATRCLLGIAAYQMADYATSERHFAYARAKDPSMVQHMDIFSTVLFYLKREVALSALVCHLMLLDSSHPIAQIAAGNAYSMQGEHSIALRCFRRAALASPAHPYAYTLAAHEAKSLNLLERAIALYRAAIRADQRFWNAWAGLAEVYMANESFDLAEYHWGMALRLNTGNAVLWDVYGRCQEALSNPVEARTAYERAISLDAKLPSTRLRLAQLHAFFGDTEKAHEQLLLTCQLAPDEPSVHLELARSYMKLGGGEFSTASTSRKKTQLEREKRGWSAWSNAQGKKIAPGDQEYGRGSYERVERGGLAV
ncbi:DNA-binding cell division cycle control protein [Ceraceosorus bombacis]|uniref:DNA-binding cell division cycle control protein n=1 Tax=Ceraceosorus bombacis TaxID=401625 RepID=A0A0P1BQQ7_9BASI|nr:DNA-binding cell division cycle control protein [Ceraceosorus bombacis]